MRFTVTGEWTRNHLLALIVWFFLFFALFLWLTNVGLYFHSMGLSPESVVDYYRGNEELFRPPRSIRGLLEVSHFHLFAMGIMLTTLTHLLLFVPTSQRLKIILVVASFSSAFLDEASGWLVLFLHPGFAYLKVVSFLVLQGSYLTILGLVAWALVTHARSAYRESESPAPSKQSEEVSEGIPIEPG